MSTKTALTILFLLLPLAYPQFYNKQIYFPDDENFMAPQSSQSSSGLSGSFLPSQNSLNDIRTGVNYQEQLISKGLTKLTLAINKIAQEKSNNENIVFAPLNIAAALALVLLGANGKTFDELSSVLGFAAELGINSNSEQIHLQLGQMIRKVEATAGAILGQQVTFADAVFVQNNYPIRKLYKDSAENLYESEVLNVDFESDPVKAKQVINAWVSDRTRGKITDILNDVPRDTKVVIASAMYFKAQWEYPFMNETTERRDFFPNGRKSRLNVLHVDMMANVGQFPYYKDDFLQAEILGFPYKGNASVMYVVMPFNSDQQKLKQFEARINENDLQVLADHTTMKPCQILFPKMKIESTLRLKPILRKLGVTSLFDRNEANLGLLSPGKGSISKNNDSKVNPIAPFYGNPNEVLIFSRLGETINCSAIFDRTNNISTCQDTVSGPNGQQTVMYKKFGDKVGRRIVRNTVEQKDTIDSLRKLINKQSTDNSYENPGLFAEDVIHKVYMDITETGTEAAASTLVTLYRSFRGVTFRVDVPFLFFIRHEETKTILFWGSVYTPTPSYRKG